MTIRQIAFLVIAALIPCGASAQAVKTTSVTVNATDSPDAQAWANGTYVTSLVINPGTSTATSSPGPSGVLDSSGNATFTLTSENDITFPTSGKWQVTVCPQMGCSVGTISPVNLSFTQQIPSTLGTSVTLNMVPPSPRLPVYTLRPTNAYRDSEIVAGTLGSQYFNLLSASSQALKYCSALPCGPNWLPVATPAGNGTVSGGVIGQPAAYSGSTTVDNIPLYVAVDAIQGAGIGAAPTAWASSTTYPLCQSVSFSAANYLAVSATNINVTPGTNRAVWYPVPNGSRPTQFDCAFYVAQSQVTSTVGVNIQLGSGVYSSCIGMNYPTVGSPGLPGVNIIGDGPGVSTIQQTCTKLSGSGGDGLAMLNVPIAGTDFFLPRLIFSGFTLDANGLAWNFDLGACQQCFIRNVDLLNPAFGSDHAFQAGTIGGAHKGWVFELNMENVALVYNAGVTGHGHGNGAARFNVTVSGGVPSIAVTNGGANYDAAQLTVRLVKQGGLEACSSPGTNTPTVSGGVITAIASTATGCAATGSTFVQIYPGLQVAYGFKFSNMTDSDMISNLDTGVGATCGIYTANVDAFNVYYKLHPQGTFDGVCANGSETFIGTQIDSVYNHGINIGSSFNQLNFYAPGFEWNNTYYEGSSDWYVPNISNPPSGTSAAINIFGESCGNTPQQDGYAHIVSGSGITDVGSALPPRMVFQGGVMYCNQFTSATQPNFTTTAADVVWSPGKATAYWDWGLGAGGNTALTLMHVTADPPSLTFFNNNAASGGTNHASPLFALQGQYDDGAASQKYGPRLRETFAAGAGPQASFLFDHVGTEPAGGHLWNFDANVVFQQHLNQSATGRFAGTCTMTSGTTCTFSVNTAFSSAPICVVSPDATATLSSTAIEAQCSISSTTVTVTAGASNSRKWDVVLVGNPN